MGLLSGLFNRDASRHFAPGEEERIVQAVRDAEQQTSGEIRVFVESRCRFVDPIHRAAELFFGLKMEQTAQRNGVLVYIAMRDHQFAIFADEGIYKEMGAGYWNEQAAKMLEEFKRDHYAEGLVTVVKNIGEALKSHFPYNHLEDKNELPDNIIFGK